MCYTPDQINANRFTSMDILSISLKAQNTKITQNKNITENVTNIFTKILILKLYTNRLNFGLKILI